MLQRVDLVGLSKDHAVAVLHPYATPINRAGRTPLCWTQLEGEQVPLTDDGESTLTRARWGSRLDPRPQEDFDGYLLNVTGGDSGQEILPVGGQIAPG
jgi:hypothetical protein